MAIDLVASFKLLSELFVTLEGQLSKVRGTPKQRLARNIIEMFDILTELEKSVAIILDSLKSFQAESQVGMRVHIIYKTQSLFENLEEACEKFLAWVHKHKEFSITLDIFAPRAYEKYGLSSRYTTVVVGPKPILSEALETFRTQLQAVRSPDPALFPSGEVLENIIAQFEILLANIKAFKKDIRRFASTNLSVEDFFK